MHINIYLKCSKKQNDVLTYKTNKIFIIKKGFIFKMNV